MGAVVPTSSPPRRWKQIRCFSCPRPAIKWQRYCAWCEKKQAAARERLRRKLRR